MKFVLYSPCIKRWSFNAGGCPVQISLHYIKKKNLKTGCFLRQIKNCLRCFRFFFIVLLCGFFGGGFCLFFVCLFFGFFSFNVICICITNELLFFLTFFLFF